MFDAFIPETPFWEIALRGTVVYLALWLVLRLIPKRHTGHLSPNDFITLIVVGGLAADAIIGQAKAMPDILLMAIVVLFWDYVFNLAEYYAPRFRHIAQDSPTLLIHNGHLLKQNMAQREANRARTCREPPQARPLLTSRKLSKQCWR